MRRRWHRLVPVVVAVLLAGRAPAASVDLAAVPDDAGLVGRVLGHTGSGATGVPVAGGGDCDGDGHADYAFSAMRASPLGRTGAGEVYLVFGDGTLGGTRDTALPDPRVLRVLGVGRAEATGSELWMDDVTGDGLADLLIARQNQRADGARPGAGALTIVAGGAALRAHAEALVPLDLQSPPADVAVTTLVGAEPVGRLGIWMRTGDVTGDGVADVVVGADQESDAGAAHAGAVYLVRGGAHLAGAGRLDLAARAATPLAGRVARIAPPAGSDDLHFGATCQIADLDGNGRGEVLVAGTLARAGAVLAPDGAPPGSTHAEGGSPEGTVFVAWDDAFEGAWAPGFGFEIGAGPGSATIIDGGTLNHTFGEELLGGVDYDADGAADLFVGDLFGERLDALTRSRVGRGHVLFGAARLKGLVFDLDTPPGGLRITTFLGVGSGGLTADTAMQGDFDGDGIADLAFSAPHASPLDRPTAGMLYVAFGRTGGWPALVDLDPGALPEPGDVRLVQVLGARGTSGASRGDTLAYSGAAGDVDGDGLADVLTNEMLGDGSAPDAADVGNLLLVGGRLLAGYPCGERPASGCHAARASLLRLRDRENDARDRLAWRWTAADTEAAGSDLAEALAPERLAGAGALSLCVYDAAGLRLARAIPFEPGCARAGCWRPGRVTRFRAGPEVAGGITGVRVRVARRRASLAVRGSGGALAPPELPLAPPLTVQLVEGGRCWEAVFSGARRNRPRALRAVLR